jgi:hypothetical protein
LFFFAESLLDLAKKYALVSIKKKSCHGVEKDFARG